MDDIGEKGAGRACAKKYDSGRGAVGGMEPFMQAHPKNARKFQISSYENFILRCQNHGCRCPMACVVKNTAGVKTDGLWQNQ
jgi:hypothetical protein